MKGQLVTKKVREIVQRLSYSDAIQVTNCPFVVDRMSGDTLARLKKLGWVNVRREWALDNTYRTYVQLNARGRQAAEEIARLSEANA